MGMPPGIPLWSRGCSWALRGVTDGKSAISMGNSPELDARGPRPFFPKRSASMVSKDADMSPARAAIDILL
jgi:hypothetical protein